MPQIAVCEDDKTDLCLLQNTLEYIRQEFPVQTNIDYYPSGEALMEAVRQNAH